MFVRSFVMLKDKIFAKGYIEGWVKCLLFRHFVSLISLYTERISISGNMTQSDRWVLTSKKIFLFLNCIWGIHCLSPDRSVIAGVNTLGILAECNHLSSKKVEYIIDCSLVILWRQLTFGCLRMNKAKKNAFYRSRINFWFTVKTVLQYGSQKDGKCKSLCWKLLSSNQKDWFDYALFLIIENTKANH